MPITRAMRVVVVISTSRSLLLSPCLAAGPLFMRGYVKGIRMARRREWSRIIRATGRFRHLLFSRCKPLHDLFRGRHWQIGLPHCAHAHKKECCAEGLSVHLAIQPIGAFMYAHVLQPCLQVLIRKFVELHGLSQHQWGHLLPALKNLRLRGVCQRHYVGLPHDSILSKVKTPLPVIQISQIRLILVQFRPRSPLLQVFYFLEKWSMPTPTKHCARRYHTRKPLNQSFLTDSNSPLHPGSYTCSHQLGFKAC